MSVGSSLEKAYNIISTIGTGTCGDVFKGQDKKSGDFVAIKKIKMLRPEEGFPRNSMREIEALRVSKHANIINLRDIVINMNLMGQDVFLVFDYCEYDLEALLRFSKLTRDQTQFFMKQIMLGLDVVSRASWIHRDLKPANIFITRNNEVKIGDFGLARNPTSEKTPRPLTSEVITIWYRPPELLMGCNKYGSEVDVWSAGCILYEMLTREVLFRTMTDNKMQEMEAIFSICGFPPDEIWEKWSAYPESELFRNIKAKQGNLADFLKKKIPDCEEARYLIQQMLQYDPAKRITVQQALEHPYLAGDIAAPLEMISVEEMHQNNTHHGKKSRNPSKNKRIKTGKSIPKA